MSAAQALGDGATATTQAALSKTRAGKKHAKAASSLAWSQPLAATLQMPSRPSPAAASASGTLVSPLRDGADWTRMLLSTPTPTAEIAGPLGPTQRTTASSAAVVTMAQNQNVARAAPATFPYITLNGAARTEQPWMAQRTQLDNSYSAAQKQEFNANWGNLAIGQGTALNATTRPDGSALPGKGIIGRGVTVAVIDTGIDATFANPNDPSAGYSSIHPEFAGRLDPRSRRTLGNGNLTGEITDDLTGNGTGHGTHVAGTIGAAMDGIGMVGIAPGATILALKGLGTGNDTDTAIAYVNLLNDVKIISGSFGPIIPNGTTIWNTGNISAEVAVVKKSLELGKIVVVAAGNDGTDSPVNANKGPTGIGLFPYFNATNAKTGVYNDGGAKYDFTGYEKLSGSIVVVANVGIDLQIAASSNRCGVAAAWCISAPGGGDAGGTNNGIFSAWPRAADNGIEATAPNGATYSSINGTSMATPHVSGALAVLMEAYPTYTTKMLVNLMFATTDDLGAKGIDPIYGQGFLRLDRALTPSPTLAPSGIVAVNSGEKQIWTSPVDNNNGTLTINNAGTANNVPASFNVARAAPVALGELLIAGEASFNTVNLQSGLLTVDGVLTSPTVNVGTNGVLQGFGEIHGDIAVSGRLSPDGEMFVAGNVTIASGGTFRTDIDGNAEIHGPGGYDTLLVSGTGKWFTAGGTYAARFRGIEKDANNTFTPSIGDRFLVVQAIDGAGVRGKFANVTVQADENGNTGLPTAARLDVLYYSTSVVSAITPESFANLAANGVPLTSRQTAVGGALDQARGAPGAAMSPAQMQVFDLVFSLAPSELPRALDQISGPGFGSASAATLNQTMQFGNAIQQRLDAVRGGMGDAQSAVSPLLGFSNEARTQFATSLPGVMAYASGDPRGAPAYSGWSVWAQAVGATANVGADASGPASTTRGGGIAFGADRIIDANLLVGIAGMYANAVTTSDGGVRANADTYAAAIYASWTRGWWEADGLIGAGNTTLSTQRNFTVAGAAFNANGSTSGVNMLGSAEVGYRMLMPIAGNPGFVKPVVGVSYGDFRRNPFTETGAGGFNLTVMGDTPTRVMSKLGFVTGFAIQRYDWTFRPELRLAWGHDFADTAPSVQSSILGAAFTTQDSQPGRDAALVGVQVAAIGKGAWQFFGGYTGDFRGNATTHAGNLGARVRW